MTIKDVCAEYRITPTDISKWFGIPMKEVQAWYDSKITPPDYVVNMIVGIIERDTRY